MKIFLRKRTLYRRLMGNRSRGPMTKIKLESLKSYKKKFNSTPRYCLARNALTRTKLGESALDWERFRQINHSFSHKVPQELKVTAQKQSGRCWLFAATNLLRLKLAQKYKLEEFEFSQAYLFFWDKLEKANYFLQCVIDTASEPIDSRLVMHLFSKPLEDGGQWHMFVSLVEKYGLVPKSIYPDSSGCMLSTELNQPIIEKLREYGAILREHAGKKANELSKMKDQMIEEVYRMLAIHLGVPPDKFDWEFKDKNKKFHAFRDLTPLQFFHQHVKTDLGSYVCLVHSPRKITPYYKPFSIQQLGNVVEGRQIIYVNVPIEIMKDATLKTIKEGEPVWFGCDVGKYLHRELGIMDQKLFDYDLVYDVKFNMTKEERINHGSSMMTHAMLFTGVNIVDGKPNRWRVENSWGEDRGEKGYYIMDDDWFDEYMFEVAIESKHLPKKVLDALKEPPIFLPPWDPFGSLA